jgi:hypothetical protein
MRRIISNHPLLNWHNAAKLPISRQAGLRRDRNAAARRASGNEVSGPPRFLNYLCFGSAEAGRMEKDHGIRR